LSCGSKSSGNLSVLSFVPANEEAGCGCDIGVFSLIGATLYEFHELPVPLFDLRGVRVRASYPEDVLAVIYEEFWFDSGRAHEVRYDKALTTLVVAAA